MTVPSLPRAYTYPVTLPIKPICTSNLMPITAYINENGLPMPHTKPGPILPSRETMTIGAYLGPKPSRLRYLV